MKEIDHITVEADEIELRLDQFLAKRFQGHYSRTYFQELIKEGLVLVNGRPVKKRVKTQEQDEIEIEFAALRPSLGQMDLTPENIPLDILYEDDDILVINKPAGLVVHPAPGHWTHTFVNALIYHCSSWIGKSEDMRPGIVHRLDKDTSGVLIAAKNRESQGKLVAAFASRQVEKSYLAITVGNPGNKMIAQPIGRHPVHRQKMAVIPTGRAASSKIETLNSQKGLSLVRVGLQTGRTHQIRVHLSSIGTPVLGDPVYGSLSENRRLGASRQMLHAEALRLTHPSTGKKMAFLAPLPDDFQKYNFLFLPM